MEGHPFGGDNVVDIDPAQYGVFFAPDGRHAVANALYWEPDIAGMDRGVAWLCPYGADERRRAR